MTRAPTSSSATPQHHLLKSDINIRRNRHPIAYPIQPYLTILRRIVIIYNPIPIIIKRYLNRHVAIFKLSIFSNSRQSQLHSHSRGSALWVSDFRPIFVTHLTHKPIFHVFFLETLITFPLSSHPSFFDRRLLPFTGHLSVSFFLSQSTDMLLQIEDLQILFSNLDLVFRLFQSKIDLGLLQYLKEGNMMHLHMLQHEAATQSDVRILVGSF
ncbi:hypothetical protein QVD17_39871 [Tagetes erecta]|uniref:Uncharacterized protein n=1 Tax=Tagetes erecta TaxID=13708 RepID=A0AAD8JVB7_TARER|nr:hypothetical protein QVD17_39871 [Tagetes erecta]